METYDSVGIRGSVVVELSFGLFCGECCRRLLRADGVESNKHCTFYGSGIEKKKSDNCLDACYLVWRKYGQIGCVFGVLEFLAVNRLIPFVR